MTQMSTEQITRKIDQGLQIVATVENFVDTIANRIDWDWCDDYMDVELQQFLRQLMKDTGRESVYG